MENKKNRWLLVTIIIAAAVVLIGMTLMIRFVADEVNRKVPVEVLPLEQWERLDKIREITEFENMLSGKWLSLADSSIIEFEWANGFSTSNDNETYIFYVIKPNLDYYLEIRRMKCDTVFSVDSPIGSRNRSVNYTQVEYFKNRILSLDEKQLILESFLNDSNAVIFIKEQ